MSAYFRAPKTQAYFSDPATFSGSTLVSITSVSAIRLGEVFTITTDGAVNLTTATVISATFGGIALTGIAGITTNTVNFTAPSAGLQLGANHDLIVTVDGSSSAASSQAFLPPTGFSVVTLTGVDANSWLNDPDYIGNIGGDANNIGIGDQLVYQNTTNEAGHAVTISSVGLSNMPGASAETANQTISWFYLDAQDSYAAGPTAVLTLLAPTITTSPYQVLLEPPTGKLASELTSVSAVSPMNGIAVATDIVIYDEFSSPGGYAASLSGDGIFSLGPTGVDEATQTINWTWLDASAEYSAQAGGALQIVLDVTAPAITLLGNSTVTITEGDVYTDAGATALDSNDGDLTSSIVTSNSVNTAVVGSYSVTYNVSDAAGNPATQVTRTVVVQAVDSIAPVITLIGSQNVTITQGGTYAEQGATWTDNVDGTGSAIVGGDTVDTQTPNTYTITYNYTDAAGNAATQVTRTVVVEAVVNVPTISANINNPMPVSIVLNSLTPYLLSQHILNPENKQLRYTVSQSGAALNAGVSLNQTTGALSLTTGANSTVSGIIVNVEEIWS